MRSKFILIMILMLSLCSACYTEIIIYPSTPEVFDLSENERKELAIKADHGDANACRRLANYYAFTEANGEKMKFWLRKGADLGDAISQYNLAFHLIQLKDKKDHQEAIFWLKKAAEQGLIDAYHRLAEIYEAGNVIEQDLVLAKKYYEKAAARGDTTALEELSEFYYEGKGCAPDKPRAYALLLHAKTFLDKKSFAYRLVDIKQKSMQLTEAEKAQAELVLELLKGAYSRNRKEKESGQPDS